MKHKCFWENGILESQFYIVSAGESLSIHLMSYFGVRWSKASQTGMDQGVKSTRIQAVCVKYWYSLEQLECNKSRMQTYWRLLYVLWLPQDPLGYCRVYLYSWILSLQLCKSSNSCDSQFMFLLYWLHSELPQHVSFLPTQELSASFLLIFPFGDQNMQLPGFLQLRDQWIIYLQLKSSSISPKFLLPKTDFIIYGPDSGKHLMVWNHPWVHASINYGLYMGWKQYLCGLYVASSF